jgi:large subunit ribosomal protein L29
MPNALELTELDDEELDTRLAEYRRELLNLRFRLATGQLDNVARLAQVRKDVARVLTVMRRREIDAAFSEGGEVPPAHARHHRVVLPAMTSLGLPDEDGEASEGADAGAEAEYADAGDDAETGEYADDAEAGEYAEDADAGADAEDADDADAGEEEHQ